MIILFVVHSEAYEHSVLICEIPWSIADLFSAWFSMSFENHSLNSSWESNRVGIMKWSSAHNCYKKKSKVDTWTSNPLHTNITMSILLTVHLTFAKVLTTRLSAAIYTVKRLEKVLEMHPKFYSSIDVIKMTTF